MASKSLQDEPKPESLQEMFDRYLATMTKLRVDMQNDFVKLRESRMEFEKANGLAIGYNDIGESCFSLGQGNHLNKFDLPIDLCNENLIIEPCELVCDCSNDSDDLSYENPIVEIVDDSLEDSGIDKLYIDSNEFEILEFDTWSPLQSYLMIFPITFPPHMKIFQNLFGNKKWMLCNYSWREN